MQSVTALVVFCVYKYLCVCVLVCIAMWKNPIRQANVPHVLVGNS